MDQFILWGTYCENALEKRTPFRGEHLDRLANLQREGLLISLGPTKCNRYVFGIFKSKSYEDLNKIIREDIYWKKGIWTSFEIYPWTQAF